MLAQLNGLGVAHCSLLVVPNYHHSGPSLGDETFAAWLRELEGQGHEMVIHGFYHQRTRRAGEGIRQKAITRLYTADEGEFYDLAYDEALDLIRTARADFTAHGLHPSGFIAPAWLLSVEAERAVRDAGLLYTTTLREVRNFSAAREFSSQSLVYSVRSDWRCALSLVWNRALFRRLARNPLLRLGLHPPDFDHPGIWRQIKALTSKAVRDRHPMTYQDWLKHYSAVRVPNSELV